MTILMLNSSDTDETTKKWGGKRGIVYLFDT